MIVVWFEWEMSPRLKCAQLVVLFGKVVNPLGGGVSLKEEFTESKSEL